mmetsp:Transcript_31231/g.58637  ORF Transcript_31231/g.58637 Transcript_31231/m.58637 type:complete len:617 (+) Transcript_31231:52-1902(+)
MAMASPAPLLTSQKPALSPHLEASFRRTSLRTNEKEPRTGIHSMMSQVPCLIGGVAASAMLGRRLQRPRRVSEASYRVVLAAGSTVETLEQADLTEEELQSLFERASKGKELVTFDQASSLDGVDAVLEEGAANLEELKVIWGNPDEPVDYEGFRRWYNDVLKLYDDFLWQDAVAPPSEAFLDEDKDLEDVNAMDDEQLLEDAPAIGVKVEGLSTQALKPKQKMKYGTLTDEVPEYQKPPWKLAEEIITGKTNDFVEEEKSLEDEDGPSTEGLALPSVGGGRQSVEITQLFRQACDENNLLSFEALKDISEFEDMLEEEDLAEEELQEMWDSLPKKNGDFIDVLAFRDLLAKVDELFEYVEEDEEDPENNALMQVEGGGGISKAKKRGLQTVKQDLLDAIARLEAKYDKPVGLGSTEEADGEVVKLAGELEDVWRDQVGDFNDFDGSKFEGTWELIYSTSVKFRRWASVLNGERNIKNGQFEALIQKFSPGDDVKYESFNEYDMEEVFKAPNEDGTEQLELCMRGLGSWRIGIQQNVVTGQEDLVLKLEVTNVEYDTTDGDVEYCGPKTMMSPMCRTFSYGFLSYMDDDYRVMRTSLTGKSLYIFQRIRDEDDEDA